MPASNAPAVDRPPKRNQRPKRGGPLVVRPVGRPPGSGLLWTQEIEDELLRRITDGEYMSNVCRDAHMPAVATVDEWSKREDLPLFGGRLALAKRAGFDAMAGRLLLRSREAATAMMADKDGNERVDPGMTGAIKLECDVALRLLPVWDSRYAPQPAQFNVSTQVNVVGNWESLDELRSRMAKRVGPVVEG